MNTVETITQPITEETCYLLTDAGLDALRLSEKDSDLDAPLSAEAMPEEQADAFMPDTADKVDWVLAKIADARARAARIRENADAMAKEAERDADGLLWRYGAALQAFCRAETDGRHKKSVRLYNGVLGYRTKPASVTVSDDAAALQWAQVNLPQALRQTLDRKALVDALMQTGEVVPFAAFTPAEETFYIK